MYELEIKHRAYLFEETIEFYLSCKLIKNNLTDNLREDFIKMLEDAGKGNLQKLRTSMHEKQRYI